LIELPITRLRPEATIPERAYAGDAGLDLAACERAGLAPGERATVGTGLAVAIPEGHAGFVQPRSGLAARHGVTIVNSPGLIDAGYRGELRIVLLNTDASESFTVEPGMRIAQLVVLELPRVELLEVEELPASVRGIRGFRLLEGVRGEPGADLDLLCEILLRLAQLAQRHPRIREVDINPFLAGPDRSSALAVDARIRVGDA